LIDLINIFIYEAIVRFIDPVTFKIWRTEILCKFLLYVVFYRFLKI